MRERDRGRDTHEIVLERERKREREIEGKYNTRDMDRNIQEIIGVRESEK